MDAEKAGGEGRLRVRYDIRNFGPIREGGFELAPLTVFIGPNGSGKTYAATVAYLFTRALAESITVVMPDMLLPDAKDRFRKWVTEWPERAAGWMERRMAEYFGRESVNGLPRRGEDSFQIAMTWERGETSLHLRGHWQREQNWRWESEGFDRLRPSFPLPDLDAQRAFFGDLIAGKIATPLSYLWVSRKFTISPPRAPGSSRGGAAWPKWPSGLSVGNRTFVGLRRRPTSAWSEIFC